MTTFEDMPDGAGKRATEDDYRRIWLHMKSRNRHPSIRSIMDEIAAQNFLPPSVATSQRWAKKLGLTAGPIEASDTASVDKRASNRKAKQRERAPEATAESLAEKTGQEPARIELTLKTRMTELLKADNSSTQLAITENRTRMAFNVALMEFYADNPTLLAGPRDTAALLDALTVSTKVSGGASIDITLPTPGEEPADGISPNGHPMKTVGSPIAKLDGNLVTSFNDFKARLRDGAGA